MAVRLCLSSAQSVAHRPFGSQVIFPHENNIKQLVQEKGLANGSSDLATICKDSAVRDAVLKELNAVGKKAGFKPLETLQTVVLTDIEWTPQNGLLTGELSLLSSPRAGIGRSLRRSFASAISAAMRIRVL